MKMKRKKKNQRKKLKNQKRNKYKLFFAKLKII